jgi:hypothetical protein
VRRLKFKGLKARKKIAQGNALGKCPQSFQALKWRQIDLWGASVLRCLNVKRLLLILPFIYGADPSNKIPRHEHASHFQDQQARLNIPLFSAMTFCFARL